MLEHESDVESDDGADSRPWRGVLAVKHPRKILFTKWIDIRPGALKVWTPDPVSGRGVGDESSFDGID